MKRLAVGGLVIVALAAVVAILWIAGAYNTTGLIFVGSPEVYTRERLVNDRYDQDFWLHSQLDLLDKSTALLTSVVREKVSAGANVQIATTTEPPARGSDGDAANGGDGKDTGAGNATITMPFDQEFLIRASVRDAIRQLILENLLDDRHDLTGNSVYGLKFDFSVVAGESTFDSAFVKASITATQPISDVLLTERITNENGRTIDIPSHVKRYFDSTLSDVEGNKKNVPNASYSLYRLWIDDVGSRLNTYVNQIYDTTKPSATGQACGTDAREEWERRILQAVNDVLGVDDASFDPAFPGDTTKSVYVGRGLRLPPPWRNHIRLLVSESTKDDCRSIPVFSADAIWDAIYLIDGKPSGSDFMEVDAADDTTSVYISTQGLGDLFSQDPSIYEDLQPRYRPIGLVADYLKNFTDRKAMIPMTLPGMGSPASIVLVPSGFFNFIESAFRTDAYTYALFPKTEVFGVLAEQTSDFGAAISAAIARQGQGQGSLSTSSSQRGFQAAPRSVGFSEASTRNEVEFGWVIGGRGRLESTQKSGLALVSVPAWTNELNVHVETGWVRRSGALAVTRSYDFTVPIPPDYEAFDGFVGGSRTRREPRISNDLMVNTQELRACDDISIIVPGFRLWRSTVVTLGSQVASRITVLPNMRGIVARFDDLFASQLPTANESVKLRVWTSEGVDTATTDFNVTPPRNGAISCSATVSGDDDPGKVATGTGTSDR